MHASKNRFTCGLKIDFGSYFLSKNSEIIVDQKFWWFQYFWTDFLRFSGEKDTSENITLQTSPRTFKSSWSKKVSLKAITSDVLLESNSVIWHVRYHLTCHLLCCQLIKRGYLQNIVANPGPKEYCPCNTKLSFFAWSTVQ